MPSQCTSWDGMISFRWYSAFIRGVGGCKLLLPRRICLAQGRSIPQAPDAHRPAYLLRANFSVPSKRAKCCVLPGCCSVPDGHPPDSGSGTATAPAGNGWSQDSSVFKIDNLMIFVYDSLKAEAKKEYRSTKSDNAEMLSLQGRSRAEGPRYLRQHPPALR